MSDKFKIKDIGSAREKWLNQHDIHTYADLANANAEWIHEQLKTEGKTPVPLETIQNWIEEASLMATSSAVSEDATNVIPFQPQQDTTIIEDGWDEFASFYVSYQHKRQAQRTKVIYRTYADHIEANENKQWEGVEGSDLCRWIMEHVDNIISKVRLEDKSTFAQTTATTQKQTNSDLVIDSIEVQNDIGERVVGTVDTSFLSRALNSCHRLTITPILSVHQMDEDSFTWQGTMTLHIAKIPKGQLIQESQQQHLQLSSLADVHRRHSFQDISLAPGLYRIQVILWKEISPKQLPSAKEYIFQMI